MALTPSNGENLITVTVNAYTESGQELTGLASELNASPNPDMLVVLYMPNDRFVKLDVPDSTQPPKQFVSSALTAPGEYTVTCFDKTSGQFLNVQNSKVKLPESYDWTKGKVEISSNNYESWQTMAEGGTVFKQVWDARSDDLFLLRYTFADQNGQPTSISNMGVH